MKLVQILLSKTCKFTTLVSILERTGMISYDKIGNKFITNDNTSLLQKVEYFILGIHEFIRNVKAMKKSRKGRIIVYTNDAYIRQAAKLLCQEFITSSNNVVLCEDFNALKDLHNEACIVITLGLPTKNVLLESFRKSTFLVHSVSTQDNLITFNIYNLYADLSNFHKIVFLFALVDSIINHSTSKKTYKSIKIKRFKDSRTPSRKFKKNAKNK